MPILKPKALTNNNVEWQRYRRLEIYHRCMDPVVDEINQHCSEDKHFRFADGNVSKELCFWHPLSMDGWEIAATNICSTDYLPVCECPMDELDRTDVSYPLRSGENFKFFVEAAQAELLEPDGTNKDRCIGQVQCTKL